MKKTGNHHTNHADKLQFGSGHKSTDIMIYHAVAKWISSVKLFEASRSRTTFSKYQTRESNLIGSCRHKFVRFKHKWFARHQLPPATNSLALLKGWGAPPWWSLSDNGVFWRTMVARWQRWPRTVTSYQSPPTHDSHHQLSSHSTLSIIKQFTPSTTGQQWIF